MIFTITSNQPNINFLGRTKVYSNETLNKIFLPLLENKNMTREEFVRINSDISFRRINIWFKENFGMTMVKFFSERRNEKLINELNEYRKSGLSNSEIVQIMHNKDRITGSKLRKLSSYSTREELYKRLEENIPRMLKDGYTISRCSKELGVDEKTIRYWIQSSNNEGLLQYRRNNKITVLRDYYETYAAFKAEFTDFFENDGTIDEAMKKFKKSRSSIYSWLRKFNIKPDKKRLMGKIEQKLPELINSKLNLSDISHKFGVSKTTIARYIKKLTGQNYKDVKKQ